MLSPSLRARITKGGVLKEYKNVFRTSYMFRFMFIFIKNGQSLLYFFSNQPVIFYICHIYHVLDVVNRYFLRVFELNSNFQLKKYFFLHILDIL